MTPNEIRPIIAALAIILCAGLNAGHRAAGADAPDCAQALAGLSKAGADFLPDDGDKSDDRCKHVTKIVFSDMDAAAVAGLTHLRRLPDLGHFTLTLHVFDARMSEALAAHAEVLSKLQFVDVYTSLDLPVSDTHVCHLSKIPTLRCLSISSLDRIDVTDDGLQCLGGLQKLTHLSLNNTRVTDGGLVHLKGVKNLTYLSLLLTDVTGEGLSHLTELPLRTLFLVGSKVGDDQLKHLPQFAQLERLAINECPIDGTGLKHVANVKTLRNLSLSMTNVTDESLAVLQRLPKLEELFLYDCSKITDAAVESLAGMQSLKRLVINGTQITKAGVERLHLALPDAVIEHGIPEEI